MTQAFVVLGGLGPFSLSALGSWPTGLALQQISGDGRKWAITGLPTVAGTTSLTVKALDVGTGKTLTHIFNNKVLNISTASLPNGTLGVYYTQALVADGGSGSYVWSVSSGSLPAGLTLDDSGSIVGTPTTSATSNFTVKVQDFSGIQLSFEKALSLTVAGFNPAAVNFVPAAYLTRGSDLTGNADGKKGLISFWFKLNGSNGQIMEFILADGYYFEIRKNLFNQIEIFGYDSGGTQRLRLHSTSTYVASAAWHHVLISYDTGIPGTRHLYIDDVDETNAVTFSDGALDYTQPNYWLGATGVGGSDFDGCLTEFYLNLSEYLDITQAINRRKFDDGGTPLQRIDLGSDGSLPTGSAPIVYLNRDHNNFHINSGTGGNFTVTGTLTACSDTP